MFINFNANTGVSINSFRAPGAYFGEITDVAEAVTSGAENVCCDLDGAKYALEDGSIWGDSVSQEALETLHAAICDYEKQA